MKKPLQIETMFLAAFFLFRNQITPIGITTGLKNKNGSYYDSKTDTFASTLNSIFKND